jgi:hypothetical protein
LQGESTGNGCRDCIFAVLFLAHLVGAYFVLNFAYATPASGASAISSDVLNVMVTASLVSACIGIAVGMAYLLLLKQHPASMIACGLWTNVVLLTALAIFLFTRKDVFGGIIFGLFALLSWCLITIYKRWIPLCVEMIHISSAVMDLFPAIFGVALACLLLMVAYVAFTIVAIVRLMGHAKEGGSYGGYLFYLVFSCYWTTQVIRNVVHTTAAGVFGTYYFESNEALEGTNPTLAAFGRTITTSFGTICFGSLLVAFVEVLFFFLRQNSDDNICSCILACIYSCVKDALEFINKFAFTCVAITGEDFCSAAKSTW